MADTFDIRFDRTTGLTSIFDAPANSLRWKGAGRLSVDAEGISVALKRSLVSLLTRQRSQRIPAQNIKEVYREGEALRVEFATDENPRAVLPFWTRDRDTAAQIMQLLPTSRTIEFENSANSPPSRGGGRTAAMALAVVLVVGLALFIWPWRKQEVNAPASASIAPDNGALVTPPEKPVARQESPSPAPTAALVPSPAKGELISEDEARKLAILAADPVDWTPPPPKASGASAARDARLVHKPETLPAAEPAADAEGEAFVPIEVPAIHVGMAPAVFPVRQGTLAYDAGRELLGRFEAAVAALSADYRSERKRFDEGGLGAPRFADALDGLAVRWQGLSEKLLGKRQYSDPALSGLRAALLSVLISQRIFLTGYAAGLRTADQARIDRAFEELDHADEQLALARKYLH